ncbi:ATP-dependent DNA helicase [Methanobrevibacter sp.]|uniref:ATP-dependent DNA helicase n=1 Tax=Methanobrevibacter sp. TaxID=66852 RepID=UPI003867B180
MAIELNEEQNAIVKYEGDKFLSVQAGPGSGKTRVIVEKVKHMVKNLGVRPETFLIITFSTKAADELRQRLIEGEIPASDVQKMHISTIHSFCLSLLEATGTVGLDVVADGEKLNLFIKKHLRDLGFENESYTTTYGINEIIKKYDEYATFGVDTESLTEYLEEFFPVDEEFVDFVTRYIEENDGEFPTDEVKANDLYKESYKNAKYIQIARSYPEYLEILKRENAIDYNQMQIKARDLMDEGYMPALTNILIDEFQDTDPIQMAIFEKFIEYPETESFTVVGDINQSIYGFRGSNVNYFKHLKEKYPDKFEELYLSTNYRSTEEIIDLTQDFIVEHYDSPEDLVPAKCGSGKHNCVYFMVNETNESEAENLLEVIKYCADNGVKYSDIGILLRSVTASSSCFNSLADLLEENNIPYQVRGTGDLADNEELKYVMTLIYHLIQDDDPYYTFVPGQTADWLNLKTLTGANDDNKVLFELSDDTKEILNRLQDEFEQNVKDMDEIVCSEMEGRKRGIEKFHGIFNKDRKRQNEVFSRVKKPILSNENLIAYGITDENDVEFFHKLNELKSRVNAEEYYDRPTISEVYFELLCDITGYLTQELVMKDEETAYNLASLIPSISTYGEVMYDRGLRGAFWFLIRSIKNLDAYKPDEEAVQFMTVHKSKGLEFPVVILASLRDNGFPVKFKEEDENSVTYTPEEFLLNPKYDGDAETSHIEEEERVIYVAKTRAEDELILSSIVKGSADAVEKALGDTTVENIKAINNAPIRIKDVIDDNLDYCRLINPKDIDINILDIDEGDEEEKELVNLSFTALENYQECPLKYKLANEMGFAVSVKKEIDDGIFIHSALEIINKKILANNNEYVGDGEVVETVKMLFERANLKFKEEQPEKYEMKLETITKDVLRYYHEVGCDLTILASEYPFYIKGENYGFSGVVDLIYEKDGKLGILDYKNTSLVGEQYLAKYRKQLHFYLMALRDEKLEFEGRKIEEIQIYAIKYQKGDKLFSLDIDEEYIEELKDELKETAQKINDKKFEPNPVDSDICKNCPYGKICQK